MARTWPLQSRLEPRNKQRLANPTKCQARTAQAPRSGIQVRSSLSANRENAQGSHPDSSRDERQLTLLSERERENYMDRDRIYSLRPSEIHALTEVGKFRVVSIEDFAKFNYAGDRSRMESDLRNLKDQGLVVQRGMINLSRAVVHFGRCSPVGAHRPGIASLTIGFSRAPRCTACSRIGRKRC